MLDQYRNNMAASSSLLFLFCRSYRMLKCVSDNILGENLIFVYSFWAPSCFDSWISLSLESVGALWQNHFQHWLAAAAASHVVVAS